MKFYLIHDTFYDTIQESLRKTPVIHLEFLAAITQGFVKFFFLHFSLFIFFCEFFENVERLHQKHGEQNYQVLHFSFAFRIFFYFGLVSSVCYQKYILFRNLERLF